jgi:ribosome biogenesis GTPase
MKGVVYKSTGSWYIVKDEQGKTYNARIKGIFKIEGITSTNPIAVGDEVLMQPDTESENTTIITAINDRKNYVARQSPQHKRQHHIIAANVDQSLLFVTLAKPKTSTGFIDRFLVACEMYHVPAILVFNKVDIYKEKELQLFENLRQSYTAVGYKVLLASVKTGEGLLATKELLQNKITLLSGHSGVGKSTFINALFPRLQLRTNEVSSWSGKGLHTTTFAEMFDLPFGGKIIDTPGIRELGLTHIEKAELHGYFPEMKKLLHLCKYNNCMHINEPDCAVKTAVEKKAIAEFRYINYLNILDSINDNKY